MTLETKTFTVTRADLVAYAEASGDHNPIHQDEEVARSVGLPGVIAHGMYTLALAARALDAWAGGPGRVRELGCKFTKPVLVPDDDTGVEVVVRGKVANITDDGIQVSLEVTCGGEKVLGAPKAVLRA
jgi:acyl dehydratase